MYKISCRWRSCLMWEPKKTQELLWNGVFWGWWGGTGICAEHFLYNENNLTNCSTQRNSPPIPHTPHPLSTTTITLPYQSPEFRASLLFQEWELGRGREGERTRPRQARVDPRPSLLSSLFGVCVCAQERQSVYVGVPMQVHVCWQKKYCRKICGDTRGLLIGSSTGCTEEKSIHIPEAHNGACRGSDRVTEMPKQVHSAVSRALCGRWPAGSRQSQGALYLMVGIFTSTTDLLLTYSTAMPCLFFSVQLTVQELTDPLSSLLGD